MVSIRFAIELLKLPISVLRVRGTAAGFLGFEIPVSVFPPTNAVPHTPVQARTAGSHQPQKEERGDGGGGAELPPGALQGEGHPPHLPHPPLAVQPGRPR